MRLKGIKTSKGGASWFLRVRSSLPIAVTVIGAVAAIGSLFLLHSYAAKRTQAEVTLLELSEESTNHGQLEWKVLAEGKYDDSLDQQHHAVHNKIDAAKSQLAESIGEDDPRYRLVVARYDAYHAAIGDVFTLVKQGRVDEAKSRDQTDVRPRFRELQDALQSSLASVRTDAKRADRVAFGGTLAALGLLVALVLYWRHERQRQAVDLIMAEQRGLRRSEARFRQLVQGSSDVVMVIDAEGRIASASPSLKKVFGHEPEALQGKMFRDYVSKDDHPRIDALVRRAARDEWTSESVAFRMASPNGKWFHVESSATNLLSDPDVGGIVVNSRDATQRRFLELQLEHRAFHDPLTGLANRVLFAERVGHALLRLVRHPGRVAVIFIDLDDFKLVNDSMGHSIGDELLVTVAERVSSVLRPEDTACRMGGDEFALLIEDSIDGSGVHEVTRRVLEAISVSFELGGRKVVVGASAGVALADSSDTPETVLRNADLAMYAAKAKGKGRLAVYEPSMHSDVMSHMELKAGMQQALQAGEFYLNYQPIVGLSDHRLVGAEALVRWRHPQQGLVSPVDFIPLAEETGFIVPLGRQLLREACKQAAGWIANGLDKQSFYVSVNLSPIQLKHAAIVNEVAEALADANLSPTNLVLEITESSLVGQDPHTLRRMSELRELGVRLAVDDFGTGYSSLFLLQNFPIDILKIDKAFVDALGRKNTKGSLTEAILGLADALDVFAIAEGIETADQLDQLIGMNCEFGQGFLFSKPVDAVELMRMIEAEKNHRFKSETI